MPDWRTKLRGALHGVAFYDPKQHKLTTGAPHRYLDFQREPPSHLLKLTLEAALKGDLPKMLADVEAAIAAAEAPAKDAA